MNHAFSARLQPQKNLARILSHFPFPPRKPHGNLFFPFFFFLFLQGEKLLCRLAAPSRVASASPPLRAYRYTPSLFLLSPFSSPPPPTAAPPPRRYMDTQQSFESPSLSLDLSPREFLSGDVLAYLLTRMMCPSSMLFSCISLNDSLLHIKSPNTFTCTHRIEVKVEPSARLIKSPLGVSDRAESF